MMGYAAAGTRLGFGWERTKALPLAGGGLYAQPPPRRCLDCQASGGAWNGNGVISS